MSITLFSIAFTIMIVGMLAFLVLSIQTLPVVKAGKVTKPCKEKNWVLGKMPPKLRINGVRKDVSKDIQMVVCGNSMKNYNIFDGQRIYVREITDKDKGEIKRFPVLVFKIVNGEDGDAKYKLRKFVGYVTDDNFKEAYKTYRDRIKVSEETFVAQCTPKYKELRKKNTGKFVLSETYDEDKDVVLYSLHPVDTILGKVEYAM